MYKCSFSLNSKYPLSTEPINGQINFFHLRYKGMSVLQAPAADNKSFLSSAGEAWRCLLRITVKSDWIMKDWRIWRDSSTPLKWDSNQMECFPFLQMLRRLMEPNSNYLEEQKIQMFPLKNQVQLHRLLEGLSRKLTLHSLDDPNSSQFLRICRNWEEERIWYWSRVMTVPFANSTVISWGHHCSRRPQWISRYSSSNASINELKDSGITFLSTVMWLQLDGQNETLKLALSYQAFPWNLEASCSSDNSAQL